MQSLKNDIGSLTHAERQALVDVAQLSGSSGMLIISDGFEVYAALEEDFVRLGVDAVKKVGNDGAKASC